MAQIQISKDPSNHLSLASGFTKIDISYAAFNRNVDGVV